MFASLANTLMERDVHIVLMVVLSVRIKMNWNALDVRQDIPIFKGSVLNN